METQSLPVRLPKAVIDRLRTIAHLRSVEQGRRIGPSSLAREAIERQFPANEHAVAATR